jgi:hypothetical protein
MTTTWTENLTILDLHSGEFEVVENFTSEETDQERWPNEEQLLADYRLPNPFFLGIGG